MSHIKQEESENDKLGIRDIDLGAPAGFGQTEWAELTEVFITRFYNSVC